MIKQLSIVFACLGIAECFVSLSAVPFPSSIIGMILLFMLLKFNIVKEDSVNKVSDFFVSLLPFFFIPSAVGIMMYFDIIKASLLTIVIAAFGSTVLVLLSTSFTHQLLRNFFKKINKTARP